MVLTIIYICSSNRASSCIRRSYSAWNRALFRTFLLILETYKTTRSGIDARKICDMIPTSCSTAAAAGGLPIWQRLPVWQQPM